MSPRPDDDRHPALLRLARAHGMLTEHEDGTGARRLPSEAALLAVLRALGVDIERAGDAEAIEPPAAPLRLAGGAPAAFWTPRGPRRDLAVFAPAYALRRAGDAGVGDLGGLRRLADWAHGCGAPIVSTLPLVAGRYRTPVDGCPYAPTSRSVFGELFLDLSDDMSDGERIEADRLAGAELIDYAAAWTLKRRVLARLAEHASADDVVRVRQLVEGDPLVAEYARFRAQEDGDPNAEWLYQFAQWMVHEQLTAFGRDRLYLDLPVGVRPDGFDVARDPGLYARGVTVGAPPDAYFPEGQDWSFPPILPDAATGRGHAELIAAADRHLRYAATLRLDHVMGFWRLYWIPEGFPPDRGVYVRYPADAQLDALAVLSHEREAVLIGENLGTVPPEVDAAMRERGLLGMAVAQYDAGRSALEPDEGKPAVIAAANTHDMPTFAGYLSGRDIEWREELGLLDRDASRREHESRRAAIERIRIELGVDDAAGLYRRLMLRLCGSDAPMVVAALDDLLGETEPQNIPGVTDGYPCWRRRVARSIDELTHDERLASALRDMVAARTRAAIGNGGGIATR
ncbi:MAG: 4-alpha-glucanotransferase [Planctomycetota bacterium]